MRFTWDASKSERNLAERRFDFAFATLVFDGPTLERPDTRREYGEPRTVAVGVADGVLLTVVYTDRPDPVDGPPVRRLISARLSNRRERHAYAETFPPPG